MTAMSVKELQLYVHQVDVILNVMHLMYVKVLMFFITELKKIMDKSPLIVQHIMHVMIWHLKLKKYIKGRDDIWANSAE